MALFSVFALLSFPRSSPDLSMVKLPPDLLGISYPPDPPEPPDPPDPLDQSSIHAAATSPPFSGSTTSGSAVRVFVSSGFNLIALVRLSVVCSAQICSIPQLAIWHSYVCFSPSKGFVSMTPGNKVILIGSCLRLGFIYLNMRLILPQYEEFRFSLNHLLPQNENIFLKFPMSSFRTIGSIAVLSVVSGLPENEKSFGHWEIDFIVFFGCPVVDRLCDLTIFQSEPNEDSQISLMLLFQKVFTLRLALKYGPLLFQEIFTRLLAFKYVGFAGFIWIQIFSDSDVLTFFLVWETNLNEIAGFLSLVILFLSIYLLAIISLFSTIGVEFRGLFYALGSLSVMCASTAFMLVFGFAFIASVLLTSMALLSCFVNIFSITRG